MKRFLQLSTLIVLVVLSVAKPAVAAADPRVTVWRLFAQYDLVAISESHRAKEVHELLQSLIRDRRLIEQHVTNVVVEFGNAKYQDISDRYVFGTQVPPD